MRHAQPPPGYAPRRTPPPRPRGVRRAIRASPSATRTRTARRPNPPAEAPSERRNTDTRGGARRGGEVFDVHRRRERRLREILHRAASAAKERTSGGRVFGRRSVCSVRTAVLLGAFSRPFSLSEFQAPFVESRGGSSDGERGGVDAQLSPPRDGDGADGALRAAGQRAVQLADNLRELRVRPAAEDDLLRRRRLVLRVRIARATRAETTRVTRTRLRTRRVRIGVGIVLAEKRIVRERTRPGARTFPDALAVARPFVREKLSLLQRAVSRRAARASAAAYAAVAAASRVVAPSARRPSDSATETSRDPPPPRCLAKNARSASAASLRASARRSARRFARSAWSRPRLPRSYSRSQSGSSSGGGGVLDAGADCSRVAAPPARRDDPTARTRDGRRGMMYGRGHALRSRGARSMDEDGCAGRSTESPLGSRSKSWHPRTRRSVHHEGTGASRARRRRAAETRRGRDAAYLEPVERRAEHAQGFSVPVGLSKIPMPPRSSTSYRPRMRSSWMS